MTPTGHNELILKVYLTISDFEKWGGIIKDTLAGLALHNSIFSGN